MSETTQEWLDRCPELLQKDKDKLATIARDMPFVADISRSDLLLYARYSDRAAMLVAQARPRSIMPVHGEDLRGCRVGPEDEATVLRTLRWGRQAKGSRRLIDGGAPVIQGVWPIRGDGGKVIAALDIEANLIAYVRQKSRSRVFQRAVDILQRMLLLGEFEGVDTLTSFREHDGIVVVDSQLMIRYASGIATEHYRKLGYMDSLVGRHLSSLNTGDLAMFEDVFRDLRCYERELAEHLYLQQERQRIWIRKAVPLIAHPWNQPWRRPFGQSSSGRAPRRTLRAKPQANRRATLVAAERSRRGPWEWFRRRPVGVLFTIHDATEDRYKERELKIKSAMIQEVHHRVKNNLQTVASMLRMQIRRSSNDETRRILKDSVNRILSMAVVHEYLSREEGQAINVREVTQRIIQQIKQGVLSPEKRIRIALENGHSLYLPPRQATACALVINELLQNAVEHGFEERNVGTISVELEDEGDRVCITIADDGDGLPSDFDMEKTASLGLQIVQTLVQDDLRGVLEMKDAGGVRATVRFSKRILEGEGHWNVRE